MAHLKHHIDVTKLWKFKYDHVKLRRALFLAYPFEKKQIKNAEEDDSGLNKDEDGAALAEHWPKALSRAPEIRSSAQGMEGLPEENENVACRRRQQAMQNGNVLHLPLHAGVARLENMKKPLGSAAAALRSTGFESGRGGWGDVQA
jgi:hypothetical protein